MRRRTRRRALLAWSASSVLATEIAPSSAVVRLYEPPEPTPSALRSGCPRARPLARRTRVDNARLVDAEHAVSDHKAVDSRETDMARLSLWHDATTWPGGRLPTAGSSFRLPAHRRILITRSPGAIFGLITIPDTSALLFGESASGITLEANGISVYGALLAGSETCRLETRVTITLHGTRPYNDLSVLQSAAFKGLHVAANGILELHGYNPPSIHTPHFSI